jgi:hypothetical protein
MQFLFAVPIQCTAKFMVPLKVYSCESIPSEKPEPQAMEDLELIASSDSLHLYENLEFYQWLEVIEGNAG